MKNISKVTSICVLVCGSVTMANAFSLFGWFGSSDDKKEAPKVTHHEAVQPIQKPKEIQISRYTTQKEEIPSNKIDLLQQNISISFGPSITNIKQALEQLLENTGLRLQNSQNQDEYTQAMLANPLPATQRVIQNASLKQTLLALTGDKFDIVVDPIHRIISFKIKPTVKAIYLNQQGNNNE